MTLEELEEYLEENGLKDKWKRNSSYWTKRFELLEDSMNNKGIEYFYDLERIYSKAISETEKDILKWYNRFATKEHISLAEAKRMLNKNELKEFRMTLQEYIEKGESLDPQWLKELERASTKVHISRLEALKMQMQQHVEYLMGNEADGIDRLMRGIYTDSYYHTAFELQKGFSIGWDLMKLDTNAIDKVMAKPWTADGMNFSERIWGKYRPELIKKLHDGLTLNIIRGESPDKLIDEIAKQFNVKKSQAQNLVQTEKAFFMSISQRDMYREMGVEQYEIVATLDSLTSEICREMDGKVFDTKDYMPGVTAHPFHPRCRSATAPYFNDEFTVGNQRAARDEDGQYYTVPSDMTYPEWYEKFVEGKGKTNLDEFVVSNAIASGIMKLTKDEEYAVKSYTSFESYPINDALRNGYELNDHLQKIIDNLDSALAKLPKYEGKFQTRSLYFYDDEIMKSFVESHVVGKTRTYEEFLSTTIGDAYNPDGQVQILILNGKNGIDLTSFNKEEMEVLYQRGSTFKVLDKYEENGKTFIVLEEV